MLTAMAADVSQNQSKIYLYIDKSLYCTGNTITGTTNTNTQLVNWKILNCVKY